MTRNTVFAQTDTIFPAFNTLQAPINSIVRSINILFGPSWFETCDFTHFTASRKISRKIQFIILFILHYLFIILFKSIILQKTT